MNEYLLIAHAERDALVLLDTTDWRVMRTITTAGRVAVLGASSDRRYALAIHRDDASVSLISVGTGAVRTIATPAQPTHFHAHNGRIVIFNDGAGSVSMFDEATLATVDVPQIVDTPPADHGSAVLLGDALVVGHLRQGSVTVYAATGEALQHFDCCPVLHGVAQVRDNVAVFGCSDGVLLIHRDGAQFTAHKLDNPPETPQRVRVGIITAHPDQPLALGNLGEALALIDVQAQRLHVLPLPAQPLRFCFSPDGEHILALTVEGTLYRLDVVSGDIVASMPVAEAVPPPKGPDGKPRPTFACGDQYAYIVAPAAQTLTVVDLASWAVVQQINLPHALPNALVVLNTAPA